MSINLIKAERNLPDEVVKLCKEFSKKNGLMMRMNMYSFMAASILNAPIEDDDYVIEIGTYHGFTAIFVARMLNYMGKNNKVVSIDPFDRLSGGVIGSHIKYMQNVNRQDLKEQCIAISSYSSEVASLLRGEIPFMIIDGGHKYENIKSDIELYLPKLKIGGIAYLHDNDEIRYPGITRAISELIRGNKKYNILMDDYYFIIERIS
ncbi:hypothetical protein SH1V18_32920 [Vallitalea longa]|uniref:O-methyltransferase n=1 Tax=Vallitalea longa TaxID=2936439 RepID=A0A9W6DGR5_9FIRM|nr:class I SAM-dependent methyltransferase [Vallitalea longa]GKX30812.1 hypothetical protein SH1V18_32920 [Vallitalea longa]